MRSAAYATALSQVPGVARVDAATGSYAGGGQVAPATDASARFVAPDAHVAVGGAVGRADVGRG